jgi:Domain of unknown function (DUF6894)
MPRYYFHVTATPEITGVILRDVDLARAFAKRLHKAMAERAPYAAAGWSVAVIDDRGVAVFETPHRRPRSQTPGHAGQQ